MAVMVAREWIGSKYETPESAAYVGLSQSEAVDAARTAGITAIRILDAAGGSYTMELNPRRLDLLVEGEVVVAAGFF
jgi:hypothetical protein